MRYEGAQVELIGLAIVDDEVGPQRQQLLPDDGGNVGGSNAIAPRVQNLEPEVWSVCLGPQVEPVSDVLRV